MPRVSLAMLLGSLIAAPPSFALVPYRATDARLKRVRLTRLKDRDGHAYERVTVDGYPLKGKAGANATVGFCPCYVPGGIAGSASAVEDGACLVTSNLGFVSWKGHVRAFDQKSPSGVARDGSVLFVETDEWPFREVSRPGSAEILRGERKIGIGPAESAQIAADGTVYGYALRGKDGRYCGEMNASPDACPEAFRWKDGRRTILGRFYVAGVGPRGDVLGMNLVREPGNPSDDAASRLFIVFDGRATNIPIGGRTVGLPFLLRPDGSVVFGLRGSGGGTVGLGLWRDGRVERVDPKLRASEVDWIDAELDQKGRIVVEDADGRRWQVVRR